MPDFTIFSPKMRARTAKLVLAAVMVAFVVAMVARVEAQQKVLLKDVQVVSAVPGQLTTARRSRPVPQLQCQGRVCEVTVRQISPMLLSLISSHSCKLAYCVAIVEFASRIMYST